MKFDSDIHHRRSVRLKNYDYSQNGQYFVTICTHEKTHIFGKIVDEKMILNDLGKIAKKCWQEIPDYFPDVELGEFVIMPNHMHGIINIVGAQNLVPNAENKFQKIIPKSLGSIIRGYKTGVTKWARKNSDIHIVWQKNFHEHIIRDEKSFENIQNYILNNPVLWKNDCYFM